MGLGYVLDAELGPWGDGTLVNNAHQIVRDTVLIGPFPSLTLQERRAGAPGMRVAFDWPSGSPTNLIAANWADRLDNDSPSYTPSSLRQIYDLVLRLGWDPTNLAPGDSLEKGFEVVIQQADFGDKAFLRWNFPDHLSLDHGNLFPSSFVSIAQIGNLTAQSRQGILTFSGDGTYVSGGSPQSVWLNPSALGFSKVATAMQESYQKLILNLTLTYSESGVVIDSLVRTVLYPAVPLSDTGLVVTIDSLVTSHAPAVSAIFEVQRKSTGAKIMNLATHNIALYDNGGQVQSYSLGHDTTKQGKTDIVFVLDVTGSMANEIEGEKSNIEEFADSLKEQGTKFRLGMVTFLDAVENVYDFTTDVAAFKSNVANQFAHGGDDAPENSLDALWRGTELAFDPQASRMFIWITDADYHILGDGTSFTNRTTQQVVTRLLETGATVYAIGDQQYQTDWYNPIVNATGGLFYDIYGKFRDILLDISRKQTTPRYLITYQPPSASTHQMTLWVHYGGLGGNGVASFGSAGKAFAQGAMVQCYPNPFNPSTIFRLQIPNGATASLTIYNILGQELKTFRNIPGAELTQIPWDAKDNRGSRVAGGVYFARCTVRTSSGEMTSQNPLKIIYLK